MIFYVGLHIPSHAQYFDYCCISISRIKRRKSNFSVNTWIMDSGAFTEISTYGCYRSSPEEYAKQIERWRTCGYLFKAVSQDYMCEPFVLEKTGLSIRDHQKLTIERYDILRSLEGSIIMPVIQGWDSKDYLSHLDQYGSRLAPGMRVGIGSICKRNRRVSELENMILQIKQKRPDLRFHGFGIKLTALESKIIQNCLTSSDSMAWSWNARFIRRNGNDVREAISYTKKINQILQKGGK